MLFGENQTVFQQKHFISTVKHGNGGLMRMMVSIHDWTMNFSAYESVLQINVKLLSELKLG